VWWIGADRDPRTEMDSLPGVMWHLSDAWARRHEPNVVLVHYQDLCDDLDGEMRRLAGLLGVSVPGEAWPPLVEAAGFASMRASAGRLIGETGVLKSPAAFFRRGTSGAGAELLSSGELAEYQARAGRLAPPDMLRWLHSPERAHPS
jgi:hypothetical protein